MRLFSCLLLLAGFALPVSAQYGNLTYNFFGPAGTQTPSFPAAVTTPSPVIVLGSPIVATPNMINSKQWSNQNPADLGNYYSFSFTTTQAVSLPSLTMNAFSSNVGPSLVDLRSSLTGFNLSDPIIQTQTITPDVLSPRTFTLPTATFGMIPSGTTVEFRLYGYGASNNGTNSEFGFQSANSSTHGITVPVNAPVPEPGLLGCLTTLGLIGLRRIAIR